MASIPQAPSQDFTHAAYLLSLMPPFRPWIETGGLDVVDRHTGVRLRVERYANSKTLGLPCIRLRSGTRAVRRGLLWTDDRLLDFFAGVQLSRPKISL